MNALIENIWPVHAVAWGLCAVLGALFGALLANATGSFLLNLLIFLFVLISMSFAVGQGITAGLQIRPGDFASWERLSEFWVLADTGSWIAQGWGGEAFKSTAIALGFGFVAGLLTLGLRKDRV